MRHFKTGDILYQRVNPNGWHVRKITGMTKDKQTIWIDGIYIAGRHVEGMIMDAKTLHDTFFDSSDSPRWINLSNTGGFK